jgi:hypothetical protein
MMKLGGKARQLGPAGVETAGEAHIHDQPARPPRPAICEMP